MSEMKNEQSQSISFDAIKIGLASPGKIREWSRGEVTVLREDLWSQQGLGVPLWKIQENPLQGRNL